MDSFWDNEWKADNEIYNPGQVEAVLGKCGIEIDTETPHDYLCYCPFHPNADSPAFSVNKYTGQWTCFNPTCQEYSDSLTDLLIRKAHMDPLSANIFVAKAREGAQISIADRVEKALAKPVDFVEWSQEQADVLAEQFWATPEAQEYMRGRGFNDETLKHFGVGYAEANWKREFPLVTIPMHDPKGMLIGFIGRNPSKDDKRFKNSPKLPKSKTCWNYHRAKTHGDTVIVCEATFDAMRIHQAGYPNVVALLGGHVSTHQIEQLGRTFSNIIIMTDNDKKIYRPNCRPCNYKMCQGHRPGRDLGRQLISKLPGVRFLWATYDDACIYPHNAKDAADMTDDEIRQCLTNAISHMSYELWGIEDLAS